MKAMAMTTMAMLVGCATTSKVKPPENWTGIQRVSGVAARFPPRSNFETFARGYGEGAAKGVATGTAGGAMLGGGLGFAIAPPVGLLLLPFLAVAGAAAGAVIGGVAGTAATVPETTARQIEVAQERALGDLRLQPRLADRVAEIGAQSADYQVTRAAEELGPATADDYPRYPALGSVADAVLETELTGFGFEGSGGKDPTLTMFLKSRARVVRTADGSEVG